MYYFQRLWATNKCSVSHNFSSADNNSMTLTEIKTCKIHTVSRKTGTVSLPSFDSTVLMTADVDRHEETAIT
jgi:hypothetical protein